MIKRLFANSDVYLSPITFGMMRFDQNRLSIDAGVILLTKLFEFGIDTFHTSHEYDSYEFFCYVFSLFKKQITAPTTHIVKLACPHFEEDEFNLNIFEKKIDAVLNDLNIERIDILQWLLRSKNNIDEIRIQKLLAQKHEINYALDLLKKKGKVKAFASFPYSLSFAQKVLSEINCDGIMDYCNLLEREIITLFPQMQLQNQGMIAIRPLCAGKVFEFLKNKHAFSDKYALHNKNDISHFAILFPLMHPLVSSTVLSITSEESLNSIIYLKDKIVTNTDLFQEIFKDLTNNDL